MRLRAPRWIRWRLRRSRASRWRGLDSGEWHRRAGELAERIDREEMEAGWDGKGGGLFWWAMAGHPEAVAAMRGIPDEDRERGREWARRVRRGMGLE